MNPRLWVTSRPCGRVRSAPEPPAGGRGLNTGTTYSGSATTIGFFEEWISVPMFTGLATIRRDGFVSLKVEKDSRAGWFTTIPLQATGTSLQLEINAQGLSEAAP